MAVTTVLHHPTGRAVDRLRAAFPEVEFVAIAREGDIDPSIRGDVLLTGVTEVPTLKEALGRGVRWIHTIGTGVDRFPFHLVDETQTMTCSRGGSAIAIAEWVLAVMLAFEKDLPAAWVTEVPERWFVRQLGTLHGATLGIVGYGSIGERIAHHALSFDMRVKGWRRTFRPSNTPGVEIVATLDELLDGADHVVIAASLTPETRGLIGAAQLARMKPGVHLVNIARGEIIDQEALRLVLDSGHVGRASLDTVTPEPLPEGHWLFTHERARVSPHISWASPTMYDSLYDTFESNLRRWLAGEPLEGVVDRSAGY